MFFKSIHKRIKIVLMIIILLFIVVILKVGYIQLFQYKKLNDLACERGQSLAQMALVWALEKGKLTSVILGASRSKQVVENIAALDNSTFTAEELQKIDSILK